MQQSVFYTAGASAALTHAENYLRHRGYTVSPVPTVHVTHLLLPVPSFESPPILKGGRPLGEVLRHLSENVTIFGGNLPPLPYRCVDLLKIEAYLSENAAITARCALRLLEKQRQLQGTQVLIIGWGRIAKALLPLLKDRGAQVCIALRNARARQELCDRGETAVDIAAWEPMGYDIVVNTAPAPLLHRAHTRADALLVDLASVQGIAGENVIWARGLPAKDAPRESGALIAKTVIEHAFGKEKP